jgi:hypothetical protein
VTQYIDRWDLRYNVTWSRIQLVSAVMTPVWGCKISSTASGSWEKHQVVGEHMQTDTFWSNCIKTINLSIIFVVCMRIQGAWTPENQEFTVFNNTFLYLWEITPVWCSGACHKRNDPVKNTSLYIKKNWTPWPESTSELYRSSDRRLSAKLVPTFADRWCHVVSVTDPWGRILGFQNRLYCILVL